MLFMAKESLRFWRFCAFRSTVEWAVVCGADFPVVKELCCWLPEGSWAVRRYFIELAVID